MKKISYIILAMMLLFCNMAFAQAPGGMGGGRPDGAGPGMGMPPGGDRGPKDKNMPPPNAPKKEKKSKHKTIIIDAPGMFMYGVALDPTDSVIYLTDEQMVDSAQIYKKTKFLLNRDEYSNELKTYMEGQGNKNRTCAIVFATKIKALDKKYKKHVARLKKRGFLIKYVEQDDFHFHAVRVDTEEGL